MGLTGRVEASYQADMRYEGQSFEIELDVPAADEYTDAVVAELRERFHDRHDEVYGHRNADDPVEFVNLRVVHSHTPDRADDPAVPAGGSLADALKGTRAAHFVDDDRRHDVPVYERRRLPPDESFDGPAVIEQSDTTTVVYPGQRCRVDESLNLLVDASPDGAR